LEQGAAGGEGGCAAAQPNRVEIEAVFIDLAEPGEVADEPSLDPDRLPDIAFAQLLGVSDIFEQASHSAIEVVHARVYVAILDEVIGNGNLIRGTLFRWTPVQEGYRFVEARAPADPGARIGVRIPQSAISIVI
jgi:hypothetical protein